MLKVTDIVLELIQGDEIASESLKAGLLNLSAYAEKIHDNVENATKKPVKKGTIVVALSRISKNNFKSISLLPEVRLSNLSITSSLSILTYNKTPDIERKISVLHPFTFSVNDVFSLTEGPNEITIVCTEKAKDKLIKHFGEKAKEEQNDLIAVSCEIDPKFLNTPNIYHVLFNSLAVKRINILEIVSTFTEIVFIVKREDMEQTLSALNVHFKKERV